MRPLVLAAVTLCLALAGCIVHVGSRTERTGRYVGVETLAQVQPGKSRDYALALLGEPSSKTAVEGGTEIWKWEYTESKSRESGVLLVFHGNDRSASEGAVYVELKDGVVVKAWRD